MHLASLEDSNMFYDERYMIDCVFVIQDITLLSRRVYDADLTHRSVRTACQVQKAKVGERLGKSKKYPNVVQGSAKRSAYFVKQQPGRARQKS